MLTCRVGIKNINTFEFEKEQIRKWSDKGILKCPTCESKMIYKHGEFKVPHFAHVESCTTKLTYSHPETEEHLNGKIEIYNWLKTQDVTNLKLEAWIPETKQRPDIYFEYENERYVIEYQCSPIATKYAERHRLYELAGIRDIWILGTEKYENSLCTRGYNKIKTIEREIIHSLTSKLMYYSYGELILCENIDKILDKKTVYSIQKESIYVGDVNIKTILYLGEKQKQVDFISSLSENVANKIENIDLYKQILNLKGREYGASVYEINGREIIYKNEDIEYLRKGNTMFIEDFDIFGLYERKKSIQLELKNITDKDFKLKHTLGYGWRHRDEKDVKFFGDTLDVLSNKVFVEYAKKSLLQDITSKIDSIYSCNVEVIIRVNIDNYTSTFFKDSQHELSNYKEKEDKKRQLIEVLYSKSRLEEEIKNAIMDGNKLIKEIREDNILESNRKKREIIQRLGINNSNDIKVIDDIKSTDLEILIGEDIYNITLRDEHKSDKKYKNVFTYDEFDTMNIVKKDGKFIVLDANKFIDEEIKKEIFKHVDTLKKINIAFNQSKFKGRYLNLKDFDFIEVSDYLKKISGSDFNFIIDYSEVLRSINSKEIRSLISLLIKIKNIKTNIVNLKANISFTDYYGYEPWLISEFVDMLKNIGYENVYNIK